MEDEKREAFGLRGRIEALDQLPLPHLLERQCLRHGQHGGRHRVEVDLDLLAGLVGAVDLVALALGDLEGLDLVALLLQPGLEVGLNRPGNRGGWLV